MEEAGRRNRTGWDTGLVDLARKLLSCISLAEFRRIYGRIRTLTGGAEIVLDTVNTAVAAVSNVWNWLKHLYLFLSRNLALFRARGSRAPRESPQRRTTSANTRHGKHARCAISIET